MSARRLIAALPRDFVLTLVDVGSAGGLHPRWNPFRPIISSVLFDPREPAPGGAFGRGCSRTYPFALGERSGNATLHLTGLPNMSSFLEPDPASFAAFGRKIDDSAVVATEQVPLEPLDALARADGFRPAVLKIDTQGSELQVLAGAEEVLGSVILAEIEVSFFRRYKAQPLFADIERHQAERGFELIDLIGLKRYRAANSLRLRDMGTGGGQRSGRLAYANAIFLRNEDSILEAAISDGGAALLSAVIALLAYRKPDIAARLLDLGMGSLGSSGPAVRDAVVALCRSQRLGLAWRSLAARIGSSGS